ncbi:MAG: type II secretion system protein, partial [Fimbriimonadaceae bacterium]
MSGWKTRRAFTLIEVMVAIAIVIVLASILFPVFVQAKRQADQTSWINSYRQVAIGQSLYLSDYDDRFFPARYSGDPAAGSDSNRTWVQLLLPYVDDFRNFRSPFDPAHTSTEPGAFDADIVPGDSVAKYFQASQRSNKGYNHLNLAPLIADDSGHRSTGLGSYEVRWRSQARRLSEIEDPARTLVLLDSVWDVDKYGNPIGGGSDLVNPPCRALDEIGLTGRSAMQEMQVFVTGLEWDPDFLDSGRAGGAYAWYEGRSVVLQASGATSSAPMPRLAEGCELRPGWTGRI